MITRVLLNITKHKVLNTLLIFLLILSFVGITFSSVFVYKTNAFLNEIDTADEFIVMTSSNYSSDEQHYSNDVEAAEYIEVYNLTKDDNNYDVDFSIQPNNLEIREYGFDPSKETEDEEVQYYGAYYEYSSTIAERDFGLEKDHDKSKIYISQEMVDNFGYGVGDEVTLSSISGVSLEDYSYEYNDIKKLEIGGILDYSDDENMPAIVYIPVELIVDLDTSGLLISSAELVIKGEEKDIEKLYEEVKDYTNEANVYYSKDLKSKDLDFFVEIRKFFMITLGATLVIFTLSMLSLNNNIMERRNEEFRLYNVFGLGSNEILFQLIMEKLTLLIMSLVLSIPLFIFVLRVGNTIVDKLVQYTLGNEMVLSNLVFLIGNEKLEETLYNGISAIEVNNILIIIFGIIAMFIIIAAITVIQYMFKRNSIVNQRRGE